MIILKRTRFTLLATILSINFSTTNISAAPATSPTVATAAEPSQEVSTAPAVQEVVKPSDGIKEKKLSTIFESFEPSEDISADNAVPFPVDI